MSTYNSISMNEEMINNVNGQILVFNTQFIRTNKAQNSLHYQFLQWLEQKEPVYRKKQREELVNSNYLITRKQNTVFFNNDTSIKYFTNSKMSNPIIQMNNTERGFLLLSDYLEMKGILIRNDTSSHQYNPYLLKEIIEGIEYPLFTWPKIEENYSLSNNNQDIEEQKGNGLERIEENFMNEEIIVDQQMNYNNDIDYSQFNNNQFNNNDMSSISMNERNVDISTKQNSNYSNEPFITNRYEFNWIIDTENFLRKQCIQESSRVWDNKLQWNLVRCQKGTKQLLLHMEYYLNPEMIKNVENIELGEYLHERYSPQNYIEVNSVVYQTYTIFECIDILEMIFGKSNIMVGYIWEQIENTIKYTIRLYISDIRSYTLEYTFGIPNDFIINRNLMTESTKPIFYHITEKAILSALLTWFPFLRK